MPSQDDSQKELDARIALYRDLFDSPAGTRVLEDLMARFNVFGTVFDPSPYATAFNEGQRAVVIYILEQLRVAKTNPARYLKHSVGSRESISRSMT